MSWTFNPRTGQTEFVGPMPEGQAFPSSMEGDVLNQGTGPGLSGLNWLGSGGIAGAVTGGLQGLGALANAYMGLQNYNLAKQQFGFQKGLANRNLANQAKMINTQYDSNAIKSAQLSGYSDYANREATALGLAKEKYVDGSKIR